MSRMSAIVSDIDDLLTIDTQAASNSELGNHSKKRRGKEGAEDREREVKRRVVEERVRNKMQKRRRSKREEKEKKRKKGKLNPL